MHDIQMCQCTVWNHQWVLNWPTAQCTHREWYVLWDALSRLAYHFTNRTNSITLAKMDFCILFNSWCALLSAIHSAQHIKMHTTFEIDYVQFVMLNRVETMIVSLFSCSSLISVLNSRTSVMWKSVKSMHLINVTARFTCDNFEHSHAWQSNLNTTISDIKSYANG